ncbi:hypothetical protein HPA02_35400 [Bisbaumannia pacifica]|uniref:DUF945 domain-containing protein n=1 Tax=Bisbaumannia pacifica TaxID=77098 RepID=A0A510XEX4_9GAMM|nr:DUF945 family protein [Halomonas pacifica]GEK49257.1 hypothetical protein HPA02_35400 [Halomonas pacifica]
MRKGVLALGAVVIIGGGYLAGHAVSSAIFERELATSLENMAQQGNLRVERLSSESGWFHSSGEVRLAPLVGNDWQARVPYQAAHGILTTRVEGDADLSLDGALIEELRGALGELPELPTPRWVADFHTLSQTLDASLELAGFTWEASDWRLDFQGVSATLRGERGDLILEGEVAPWWLTADEGRLAAGPTTLESHYRYGEGGRRFHQQDSMRLESLRFVEARGQTLHLQGLGYTSDVDLGEEFLELAMGLSLEEARLDDAPVASGGFDLTLERLDADAAWRLYESLRDELERLDGDLEQLTPAEWEALFEAWFPDLLALLAESPRLVLSELDLDSRMLGLSTQGEGELTFDGAGITELSLEQLARPGGGAELQRRLDGRLRLAPLPPSLALMLGLPGGSDELRFELREGRPYLNDQPVKELPW